ncbi:hypothetical protein Pint_16055 [Pistacia integerrima]|uniref:Uncharacterized protein n=1 Tax=Pistacia integerrima TaxID=434235 RepID=A0ACC0ZBJ9_9ROSI|nr:hypothetical protein Pint_16055 [Pistacia integerrima]
MSVHQLPPSNGHISPTPSNGHLDLSSPPSDHNPTSPALPSLTLLQHPFHSLCHHFLNRQDLKRAMIKTLSHESAIMDLFLAANAALSHKVSMSFSYQIDQVFD